MRDELERVLGCPIEVAEGRKANYSDGVDEAAEGVVAAIAAAGGNDEVVFAANSIIVKLDEMHYTIIRVSAL